LNDARIIHMNGMMVHKTKTISATYVAIIQPRPMLRRPALVEPLLRPRTRIDLEA
jgi:hypothetical protein